jgi:hypothetical protein
MTVGIVYLFEVIDIEQQNGCADAVLVDAADELVEVHEEIPPVIETGQLVGQGKLETAPIILFQPVLQPFAPNLSGRAGQQFISIHRAHQIVVRA